MRMKENQIEISGVNKYYGKYHALKDIDLTIRQGMFGLLGRNGAGKTTLMRTLVSLTQKQSGTITVCGVPIESAKEIRSMVGYLPQDFSMYPSMTIRESLEYLGLLSGIGKSLLKERIDLLLRRVNLTEHQFKKTKALSGGMKRRLGIAQALLHNPKVLIVDEPTAGLDPEERIRFRNLLCEVAEERIVILSTHIVGDIEATCETIAIMNEGGLIYQGTVTNLLAEAQDNVFSFEVEKKYLPAVKAQYIVTGMLIQNLHTTVRVLAETPPDMEGVLKVEPNVEDAYMWCLYKNGCQLEGGV